MIIRNDIVKCLSVFVRSKIKDEIPDNYAIAAGEVLQVLLPCLCYVKFCANE